MRRWGRRAWGAIGLCMVLSACGGKKAVFFGGAATNCRMMKIGEMPLTEHHGHFIVNALVQQQRVSLVFDTGAEDTILNQDAVARLKLRGRQGPAGKIEGIGGSTDVDKYRIHISLAGVDGDWERYVYAARLPGFDDGVISPGFFGADVDFDVPDHRIILFFADNDCSSPSVVMHGNLHRVPMLHPVYEVPKDAPENVRFKLLLRMLNYASPTVIAAVSGRKLVAAVDSGAPRNVVFLNGAARAGITPADIRHDAHAWAYGIGQKPVPAVMHSLAGIDVGDLHIADLPVLVVDQNGPGGVDMLLGADFYRRVHVWISYSSRTLVMQYPPASSPAAGVTVETSASK